jgi:hypothetical protein
MCFHLGLNHLSWRLHGIDADRCFNLAEAVLAPYLLERSRAVTHSNGTFTTTLPARLIAVGWRHQGLVPPVMASVSSVYRSATATRDFAAGSC